MGNIPRESENYYICQGFVVKGAGDTAKVSISIYEPSDPEVDFTLLPSPLPEPFDADLSNTGDRSLELSMDTNRTYFYILAVPKPGQRWTQKHLTQVMASDMVSSSGGITAVANVAVMKTWKVVNNLPTIEPIEDQGAYPGQNLSFEVIASEDINGDPVEMTAENLPAGATFDDYGDGSALFSWTPNLEDVGVYNVTFVASDGYGSRTRTVTVSVLSDEYITVSPGESIQSAIDLASIGNEIRISRGIYFENLNVQKNYIIISGGWNDDFSVHDPKAFTTLLEGDQTNTVVKVHNSRGVTIDGICVQNGKGSRPGWLADSAGGISLENAPRCTIANCTIRNNIGDRWAASGGILLRSSDYSKITNCNIYGNSGDLGGGITLYRSNYNIINKNFIYNNSGVYGGGLGISDSHDATVKQNSFFLNFAVSYSSGGGICLFPELRSTNALIEQNIFYSNRASYGGSVLVRSSGKIYMRNNFCARNSGSNVAVGGDSEIINNIFSNNTPWNIRVGTKLYFANNTIIGKGFYNVYANYGPNLIIENSIIRDGELFYLYWCPGKENSPAISYSNISDPSLLGAPESLNISTDPLFAGPGSWNFNLLPDSPCIDAGNPSPEFDDPDGTRNDMGAFGGPYAKEIPTNIAPYTPYDPYPADYEEIEDIAALTWAGGDPQAQDGDTVVYDLYMGTDINALTLVDSDLDTESYAPSISSSGTYYWRVISRDNHGAEAAGPIWEFTYQKNDPPVADAGEDQDAEATSNDGALVVLDASSSIDPDSTQGTNDNIVSFKWYENDELIGSEEMLEWLFSLGLHTVTLKVQDLEGMTDEDSLTINVQDTTAPVPDLAQLPTITEQCSASISSIPTATDSYAGTVKGTTTDPTDYSSQGDYTLTWIYNDGNGNETSQTQKVIVKDTEPPAFVTTPEDMTVECDAVPDSLTLSATDNCDSDPVIEFSEERVDGLSASDYVLIRTWNATDDSGNASIIRQNINVQDTNAPTLEVTADKQSLWPVNHKHTTVSVEIVTTDACDGGVAENVKLVSVTSDEPEDAKGNGDGATKDDIIIVDKNTVKLRAERDGDGDGRVYTLNYSVSDDSGNTSIASVSIGVPHDKKDQAVNSGVSYTVTP